MTDFATPNLPSRDFERTFQFYRAFGFEQSWRDAGWMILKRHTVMHHRPTLEAWGARVSALVDPDETLIQSERQASAG